MIFWLHVICSYTKFDCKYGGFRSFHLRNGGHVHESIVRKTGYISAQIPVHLKDLIAEVARDWSIQLFYHIILQFRYILARRI